MHGDDVHVAFDEDALVFAGDGVACLVEAVDFAALFVDDALGRVDVFGDVFVFAEGACSEGDDASGEGEDGVDDAAAVAVVGAAVVALAEAGGEEVFLGIAGGEGGAVEVVAFFEGVAEAEFFDAFVVDAALAEVAEADVAAFFGVGHDVAVVLHGELVDGEHGLALHLGGTFFGGLFLLFYFDMVLACEPAEGLLVGHGLEFH